MTKELATQEPVNMDMMIIDLENTTKMCNALMNTPHYKKIGAEGIFAIVQKAKSLNVSPLDALNGGLYCVNGKVEMSSQMMIQLIRQAGHSVTKDPKSDDTICILHGKRKDNGDVWTESFSINDAKRAGIYKNVWEKFPRNMLFARALSNLARQLFADVIKGCYVEGEIAASPLLFENNSPVIPESLDKSTGEVEADKPLEEKISEQQFMQLNDMIGEDHEYRQTLLNFMKKQFKIDRLEDMPLSIYDKAYARAKKNFEEKQPILVEAGHD